MNLIKSWGVDYTLAETHAVDNVSYVLQGDTVAVTAHNQHADSMITHYGNRVLSQSITVSKCRARRLYHFHAKSPANSTGCSRLGTFWLSNMPSHPVHVFTVQTASCTSEHLHRRCPGAPAVATKSMIGSWNSGFSNPSLPALNAPARTVLVGWAFKHLRPRSAANAATVQTLLQLLSRRCTVRRYRVAGRMPKLRKECCRGERWTGIRILLNPPTPARYGPNG